MWVWGGGRQKTSGSCSNALTTPRPVRLHPRTDSISWPPAIHPSSSTEQWGNRVQLPFSVRLSHSVLVLGVLSCRDAPETSLAVASVGAQTPARVAQLQAAVDASRRTALVAAA